MSSTTAGLNTVDFVVDRGNLRRWKCVRAVDSGAAWPSGQALLRVAKFAFTANNITYAVAGDMLSYWNFFPAEPGWGRVPVWGFGDVIRSTHPDVAEGERVFGYLPMSTYLVIQPERVTAAGFFDASPHRQALPAVYNRYTRVANDPSYQVAYEDQHMLFWPLFMTSFLLDDFLADNALFGARAVVLSSASSKTAFGLAFLLSRNRPAQCEVVGLTSPRNASFVAGLGCYDRVVTYDQLQSLPAEVPVVFVDMAGDGGVQSTLHHHFRDNMKYSCSVGATHWDRRELQADLPGAQPAFFFAPTQVQKRTKDWGPAGLQERFAKAWRSFLEFTNGRTRIIHGCGEAAVERVYLETLEGRSKPDEGHVLSLWE